MVFHIQPIAHIAAVTIHRKRLAFKDILYDQRYQLLREVVRAIVVGTAGNGDRHPISVMVCHYHHIGTCLGSAVRAMRAKRGVLRKETFGAQRAVNFIRRHLMIAHSLAPCGITLFVLTRHPCTTGGVKQVLSTQNIRHQEELRILDAAVHMAFSGKVHHIVEFVFGKQLVGKNTVTDITFDKEATFLVNIFGNRAQISGIGQGIQYHHFYIIMLCQNIFYIVGSDKSGSTGYKISFHAIMNYKL